MKIKSLILQLVALLPLCGCTFWADTFEMLFGGGNDDLDGNSEYAVVGYFAKTSMSTYYLWDEQLKDGLDDWADKLGSTEPKQKVLDLRYKEGGKDYDRWTELTDDYEAFVSYTEGVSTSYGCSIVLKKLTDKYVAAIVTVVYKDSPAAGAGLKRGDIIASIGGTRMTMDNYMDLVTTGFLYSSNCTVGLLGKDDSLREVSMTAVKMYEDPVICHSIFNIPGKKVGYLFYTSFTLKSIPDLMDICREFRDTGVSELILDLRYNGGGYVYTESILASMLAPADKVASKAVFEREVYNETLTEAFRKDAKNGEDPLESRFQTSISFENDGEKFEYNTTGYNIGLKKIYAIVDKGTASAAESILVGLMPYIPIVVIGGQTHGKFCTGLPLSADEWYTEMKKYLSNKYTRHSSIAENWGLYVMIATYADCNGENPCRPNGLTPAYTVEDVPENGIQIGDVNEPMLKKALELAGYQFAPKAAQSAAGAAVPAMEPTPSQVVSPAFGRRIRLLSALLDNES